MPQNALLCNAMISEKLKISLIKAAEKYEQPDFIPHDPVQFPHRFSDKCDIEISGLLTALMSFGNRKQIIAKADKLCGTMHGRPKEYILSRHFETDFPIDRNDSFYRMMSYSDFRKIFDRLFHVYSQFQDMEDYLNTLEGTAMERMCRFLSVSSKSPQKKINMFLRWMIRNNSPVDFGIWNSFSPADLIIPLDTHVVQVAHAIGLTTSKTYSLAAAIRITEALREIFPDDPVRGDFSLFGVGVNQDTNTIKASGM